MDTIEGNEEKFGQKQQRIKGKYMSVDLIDMGTAKDISKLFVSFMCWRGIIPRIGWKLIACVWIYASIQCLLISDTIKVLAYRLLYPETSVGCK